MLETAEKTWKRTVYYLVQVRVEKRYAGPQPITSTAKTGPPFLGAQTDITLSSAFARGEPQKVFLTQIPPRRRVVCHYCGRCRSTLPLHSFDRLACVSRARAANPRPLSGLAAATFHSHPASDTTSPILHWTLQHHERIRTHTCGMSTRSPSPSLSPSAPTAAPNRILQIIPHSA